MISPVSNYTNNITFTAKINNADEEKPFKSSWLDDNDEYLFFKHNGERIKKEDLKKHQAIAIDNTMRNRFGITWVKFDNLLSSYFSRGWRGSKNSNFYEFLTMGIFPYLTGSAMMMAVFNSVNKYFSHKENVIASKLGNKMALGVLFYGLGKTFSKSLVTNPVKWFTGVDTEQSYVKLSYKLPESKNHSPAPSLEFHKVYESLEFPYWDLNYGDETKGEVRNAYYDKIAKKLGLGVNLKDSDQEAKPRIKKIAAKTNLAKTFSSYLWAAAAVGVAMQKPWEDYFKSATVRFWQPKEFLQSIRIFGGSLVESVKDFVKGPEGAKSLEKHAGKILLGAAVASTVLGVANVLVSSNKPSKLKAMDVIDKNGKYVVD